MDNKTYVYSDELYHYGRKGMKWGQHIFGKPRSGAKGTVVAKKKKSYFEKAKEAREAKKKAAAEAKSKAAEEARKRDPKNMSDDDIRNAIARKKLENEYRALYPKQVSLGKKLASEFFNSAIKPALVDGGKHVLTNMIKQYGDNILKKEVEPSKMDKLKDKAEVAKLEKTILERDKAKIDLDKAKKNK